MPALRIDQLEQGMELEGDVLDRNGRQLVRAGTILSERDLRRFKMWGITEVDVVGDTAPTEDIGTIAIGPVLLDRYQPEVRALFKHTNMEHPYVAQLFQECLQRFVRKRSGEDNGS